VFDDEFQGSTLNTSVWTDSFDGPIAPQDLVNCYLPADVTVDNGVTFTPHVNASCGYDSGLISAFNSRFFTYGYFEARIYVPDNGAGGVQNWPAFWLISQNQPAGGEVDVMEGLGGPVCGHFHYGSARNPHSWGFCAAGDYSGWHTYAADWERGSITWYYDGVQVGKYVSSNVTSAPEAIWLDYALTDSFGGPGVQLPSSMQVAWVRAYQGSG